MVDLPALRAARPELLEQASAEWGVAGRRFGGLADEFRGQTAALFGEGSWAGAAANAAAGSLSGLAQRLDAAAADMTVMAALYRDAAAGMSAAKALLRTADDLAARSGLAVSAAGEVSWEVPPWRAQRRGWWRSRMR